MSAMLRRPMADGVLLLCLDTLTPASDSDGPAAAPDPAWRPNAARLLAHAREEGWSIGHAISRRRRPGETPWRPAEGLAPAPCEAVYHREQPSAFSSRELRETILARPNLDVVLCGTSLQGSALATAVDALRLQVRLTFAADAACFPPGERPGVEGVLNLQRLRCLPPLVRTVPTDALLAPWRPLRVVRGGRG